ncbi:uncharacterized protein zgc:193726 [Engraulis encrasicolus]|uniref:uncharacterized protein zgc:193726 n=1 Tax=Engraulis encrasicolus TaxID=184585 RepID=UPI002FD2B9D7
MCPAWSISLTAILLGCVFGFPNSFNSTQNYTRTDNELNSNATNSTWPEDFPAYLNISSFLDIFPQAEIEDSYYALPPRFDHVQTGGGGGGGGGCRLPTCALQNLGNTLNSEGDEMAGSSTSDPYGVGKK